MNWAVIPAYVMAGAAVAGLLNERRRRRNATKDSAQVLAEKRITWLLERGADATFGEYEEQARALVAHLREVLGERDTLTIEVAKLQATVKRQEAQGQADRTEIAHLQARVDELERLERANGHT